MDGTNSGCRRLSSLWAKPKADSTDDGARPSSIARRTIWMNKNEPESPAWYDSRSADDANVATRLNPTMPGRA
jgi:hypothetical protein